MCWWLARVLAVGRFEWIIFYFPFGILKSAVLPKNASIFELVRVKHVSHWALIPRRIKWTNTNSSTGESSACIRTTSIPLHSARNLIHCQPRRRARKKRQNSFSLVASTGTGYRAGGSLFHAISIFATLKATLSSLSLPFPATSIHRSARLARQQWEVRTYVRHAVADNINVSAVCAADSAHRRRHTWCVLASMYLRWMCAAAR